MSPTASFDPTLYNKDLAPISLERRTWGTYNYASLWVAMSVCIPTYMLASGLIAGGMSWKQAIGTILLGNLIVLVPMILNAHAGTKYGIPFPVFVRASFGEARMFPPFYAPLWRAGGSASKVGSADKRSIRCSRSCGLRRQTGLVLAGYASSPSGF